MQTAGVTDCDLERVRRLWCELTTATDGFTDRDLVVAETDHHRAAPEGWVAIVQLGQRVVMAGPAAQLDRIDVNTRQSQHTQLVDRAHIDEHVRPLHTLGPARLYYGTPTGPVPALSTVGPLALDNPSVQSVLADTTDDERTECGIEHTTSGVFAALAGDGTPMSVCAWTVWPHQIAQVSSLTAASHRGTGAGRAAAHRALTEAVAAGLLPQWRARATNEGSIALAERLGLQHLGDQYSIRLD